jgi:hypothetical protein
MRVLFASGASYGHVLPLAGLAQALEEGGHDVLLATGASMAPVAESLGISSAAAGLDDDALLTETRRRWPELTREPPGSWAPRMFAEIAAPAMAADLAGIIESWRPSLVIREEGEYGSPLAATRASVPWLTVGWGAPLRTPAELAAMAALVLPLWESAGLGPPTAEQMYGLAVFDPCPPSLYGSVQRVASIGRRRPIRPTMHDLSAHASAASAASAAPAAGSTRPRAYVGFGTVPLYRDAPELLRSAVARVLEAGLDVVVTASDPEVARSLTQLDADRVWAVEWVSLPSLLPTCSLVVGHGGAGTTLASLIHGVPMLLLPRGAPSQARMAEACGRRGVAEVVDPEGPGLQGRIDVALAALTSSDRYRQAATEVAQEIAALPSPQDCLAELHRAM